MTLTKTRGTFFRPTLMLTLMVAMLTVAAGQSVAQETSEETTAQLNLVVPDAPFAFLPDSLPNAGGTVTVTPSAGVDKFAIEAAGLPPNAEYIVFLTETPTAPFGDLQYLMDFETDETGSGAGTARAAIFDAFALTGSAKDGKPDVETIKASKTELDHVVVWPAESATTAPLFEEQGEMPAVSPFDSDLAAGPAILTNSNDMEAASPLTVSSESASASTKSGVATMPDTGGPSPMLLMGLASAALFLAGGGGLLAVRRVR
ncbi:MAG: hypothetical protein WKF95_16055 [Rubrobacter sp.]